MSGLLRGQGSRDLIGLNMKTHFARLALATLLAAGMWLQGSARSFAEPACQEFQLQAYRQQYHDAAQCWAREQGMKGATERCCNAAFGGDGSSGRSSAGPGRGVCGSEVEANVDWVFADRGAKATYLQQRSQGKSAFEAVVGAQAHNPPVQALLRNCQAKVEAYLAGQGQPAGGVTLSNRQLTNADCRCISISATGNMDWQKRVAYRVVNSCDCLETSVLFGSDILHLDPDPGAFQTWAKAGLLEGGKEGVVWAPAGTIVSIKAFAVRSAVNSVTCPTSP